MKSLVIRHPLHHEQPTVLLEADEALNFFPSSSALWKTRSDVSVSACRISKDILLCILLAILVAFSPLVVYV